MTATAIAGAALLWCAPAKADPPPDPISNLTADPGAANGSVVLHWTSGGSHGTGQAADHYLIKYRFNNTIDVESDWTNAYSIQEPPVNVTPPTPMPSGSNQSLVVTGLTPGTVYGFSIRPVDDTGVMASLSNSATAQATAPCSQDPSDGKGVGTVGVTPSSVTAGDIQVATVSITINGNGITTGGKITVRIPDYFPWPQLTNPNQTGYVSASVTPIGSTFNLSTDGQTVTLTVQSGSISSGGAVLFNYTAQACQLGGWHFRVFTQYSDCGVLTDTGLTGDIAVVPGTAHYVDFANFDISTLTNQVIPIDLRSTDLCGNPAPLPALASVPVSAVYFNGTNFLADPSATVSLSSAPYVGSSGTLLTMPQGAFFGRFYYKITSAANDPNDRIQIVQTDLQGNSGSWLRLANVHPLASGITGTSIDTGVISATQKTVTFSPDGDGVDDTVAVNFSIPESLPWTVEFSSNGFATVVRRLFGNAQNARVIWDGYADGKPGVPPSIAPPGVYAVRISLSGGSIVDTSLSTTLSAFGMQGHVQDSANAPLSNVDVLIYGASNRYARTDASGNFVVYGLKAGTYQVQFQRVGYGTVTVNPTVTSGILSLAAVTMAKQSILHLVVRRPQTDHMEEVWGQVQANNSDWSQQAWGTVHFARGKDLADAGDLYNVVPTSNTALTLAPGVQYRVHFNVPNLSLPDFNQTLNVNDEIYLPVLLQVRANIVGTVMIATGTNPSGTYISFQAGPDANLDGIFDSQDPSKFYFGGAYLAPNESTGTYRIFGVANGSYTVIANAPNFIPEKTQVVVSNNQDVEDDFPPMSTGGTITGTLSVAGDSTNLDGNDGTVDGFFNVPINAWSSATQTGSFRQVRVATAAAGTSGSFTLTGLQDGTYQVNANLAGYQLSPDHPTVTVTAGVGALALNFVPFTGGLSGTVTLPGVATDYNNVSITLTAYDNNLGSFGAPSMAGATYTYQHLGTGFYLLHARYSTTGFTVDKNLQIVNGLVAQQDLDLSGNTYSISGRVTTSARSPYNTLSYLVDGSTPTHMLDTSTQQNHDLPANRIIAERIQQNNGPQNQDNDPSHYDGRNYFYGTYNSSGDYTISNLTPGSYRVHNNGEIDNDFTDGAEVAATARIVKILTANATGQDISITDGYSIAGTIRVVDGSIPGRTITLQLKNVSGVLVASKDVFVSSPSATFTIDRVPPDNYSLSTIDNGYPKAYAAKDVGVNIDGSGNVSVQIDLLKASQIRGKIRLQPSGITLTNQNFGTYLSSDFYIEARTNGSGARAIDPLIDSQTGEFSIPCSPGTYDVYFQANQSLSPSDISSGKRQLVPLHVSGVKLDAGQTINLNTIELREGTSLSGTVRDRSGHPVPNILVIGYPSGSQNHGGDALQTVTNETGQYTLQGIDSFGAQFYDIVAAPRSNDGRYNGYTGLRYGEVRRTQVDTRKNVPIDFVIDPAPGVVHGRLRSPDGGDIESPFNHNDSNGAEIIMNLNGTIPTDNPLGNIDEQANPDGTFDVRGLMPGTYTLWGLARGYGNAYVQHIVVGNGVTDIGDVPLPTGFKVKGKVTRADGSSPTTNDVDTLVAVRNGFSEVLIGQFTTDAQGTIVSYEIDGFQPNVPYTVLAFDQSNDILVLADGFTVSGDTSRDFILVDQKPAVLAQATKGQDGTIVVRYTFTQPLRNSAVDLDANGLADDSEGAKIITVKTGTAANLNVPVDWLSYDRKTARVIYTPAPGETTFTLTVKGAFDVIDPTTGNNQTIQKDFQFFLGIGKQKQQRFTNAGGGVVQLDQDTSEFSAQAGTFGSNAGDTIDVVFRTADTATGFSSVSSPGISRAMSVASRLGLKSYPPEMSGAINRARTASVDPFGSFYDIFLPVGVTHFFPQGKEANLCIAYDPSVADPAALNVYYFNTGTNEFLLEDQNKTVDTDNNRICVSIAHASVFTVLNSSLSVISGAGYTGDLNVMNFPNPFDLKSKTVTLQNPGSGSGTQTIEGTMIKVSVPPNVAGALEIQIFSVTGEKVKTIHDNIPAGGAHYYVPWDGRNDSGSKLASGTYVARMTIGGANEKFFKMAVLK